MSTQKILADALSSKLAELKVLPYAALRALPRQSQERIPNLKRGGLLIWAEERGACIQITVQAYRNYFLGLGLSSLGGFRVSEGNAPVDLREDELS